MPSLITAFNYKKKLKFDTSATGANVASAQANFPVCVHINTSSWATEAERTAFFGAWNVNGKRCQFFDADGTTNLDYEVELYASGTPEAAYWVRVPQVDGNSTADYIWVAFGNDPNGTDQDNHEGVWDSNFKLVNHMNYLPGLTAYATNLPGSSVVGEASIIMNAAGDALDIWYNKKNGSYYTDVFYASASDSDLNSYSGDTLVLSNVTRSFVLKEGSTYYLFGHQGTAGYGDLYLWSSTNKTTWSILNSGNPVLNDAGSGIYTYIWNVGVVVIGSTWHMFIECGSQSNQSDVGVAYSYSTLADMNWDTHRTADHIIDAACNTHPVYVPDRSAIMLLATAIISQPSYWDIGAYSASTSSNLSLAASWTRCRNFDLAYPSIHTADPHLVVAGDAFDYNIVISFLYNQATNYQAYIDLSLNDFYDRIQYPLDSTSNKYDGVKRGTFEPTQIAGVVNGGQDFDGSNDYTSLGISASLCPTSITFGAWVKGDAWTNAYNSIESFSDNTYCNSVFVKSNGKLAVYLSGEGAGVSYDGTGTYTLVTGTWYYVAYTYDGSTLRGYVDGVEDKNASGTWTHTTPTDNFYIGKCHFASRFFNGIIDEARLSNTARTADWIKLTYYSMKKTNFNGDSWLSWDAAERTLVPFRNYYPHILAH